MGRATCLHHNQARRTVREKSTKLISRQTFAPLDSKLLVRYRDLEARLCQVYTHSRSMHDGLLLFRLKLTLTAPAWHTDAVLPAGGVHFIIHVGLETLTTISRNMHFPRFHRDQSPIEASGTRGPGAQLHAPARPGLRA